MEDDAVQRLALVPWAAALIKDLKWTRTRTASRLPKPSHEDSFLAETLATDRTIRSCLTLKPTDELDGELPYHELLILVQVGNGLNGYPDVLHGGLVATLLDEVLGLLIQVNMERKREIWESSGRLGDSPKLSYMTAYLNTTYKKPVPTPGTLLLTAKLERQDGRKAYVRGTIEDGAGTVYSVGEGLFVQIKPKL